MRLFRSILLKLAFCKAEGWACSAWIMGGVSIYVCIYVYVYIYV